MLDAEPAAVMVGAIRGLSVRISPFYLPLLHGELIYLPLLHGELIVHTL